MSRLTAFFLIISLQSAPAAALELLTEENPPLNFTRAGKPAGLATGMVTEMAKRAGIAADVRVLAWTPAFERARDGEDACVYSTVQNPQRYDLFQWVGPIVRGQYSAYAVSSFVYPLRRVDDLKKYRIGVVKDARADYLRERGFKTLVMFDNDRDIPKNLGGVGMTAVDLWITQSFSAKEVAAAAGVRDLKLVFDAILTQDYFLACGKKVPAATVAKLTEALAAMHKDGTTERLLKPAP